MLLTPSAEQPLQQGDIILDVPFIVLPKVMNVKASNVQGQSRLDGDDPESIAKAKAFSQGNPMTVAALPLSIQPGMIVTQGCDIDHRDSLTLARVFPLANLLHEAKLALDHSEPLALHDAIRRLTEGHEYPHLVYLGAPDGKVRYAADLLRVQSFPKEWKECFARQRWKTLTTEGLLYVQARLSIHAGRFATRQGFWHTLQEDDESAAKVAQDRKALDDALARLEQKSTGG